MLINVVYLSVLAFITHASLSNNVVYKIIIHYVSPNIDLGDCGVKICWPYQNAICTFIAKTTLQHCILQFYQQYYFQMRALETESIKLRIRYQRRL